MPDENDAQQLLSAPGWRRLPDDRDEATAALRQHFAGGGELLGDGSGATVSEAMLQPTEAPQSPDPSLPEAPRLDLEPSLAQILEKPNESVVLGQILRIFEVQRAAIDEAISVIRQQGTE